MNCSHQTYSPLLARVAALGQTTHRHISFIGIRLFPILLLLLLLPLSGQASVPSRLPTPPVINSVTPSGGGVGQKITINGRNFTTVTSVQFNGTTASFTIVSAFYITVFVPSGASTGKIIVTNPDAAVPSATDFAVTPTITSIANQTINVNTPTSALAFTVGDDVTPAGSLSVTAFSSNSTLFPSIRIIPGGTGAARTVTVTPAANQTGTATITLTVKDGNGWTVKTSFSVTVNTPPTISIITNQLINMGTSTSTLPFTVGDDLTPAGSLTVTGVASNTALVKSANIVLVGPDSNGLCSVTVTPAVATYSGVTTITLTVKDDGGLTTKTSFVLTVNGTPKVTQIANQLIQPGTAPIAVPFTVSDDLTSAPVLIVTAASNNTALIPTTNIVLTGPDVTGQCSITVTPVSGQLGQTRITLMVTDDGGLTAKSSFYFTLNVTGSAASFAVIGGGAGMTNAGTNTVIHGNIGTTGLPASITGFHDSTFSYTETLQNSGDVTGAVYSGATTNSALADTLIAYNYLNGLSTTGADPSASGELGGKIVGPGVYKSASDTFTIAAGGTLTLDAGGNANAFWVFQMDAALTVGAIADIAANVVFVGNVGHAENVYWVVGSAATINTGANMVGTIIASTGVTFSTAGQNVSTTLYGRALSLNASVTMVNTVIHTPSVLAGGPEPY